MDHAAKLDLAFFEDSTSYDLLRRAQQGASSRPLFMVSGVFGLIQTAIAFVSMIALLIALSPLLALVALVAPIPAFVADTRYGWRGYSFARWASPLRRRMDYLTTLVTTDTYAKEVKLFGLGPYFIDRFRQLSDRLPGSPARPRRHPLLRGVRLEHDHDPGRLADLPVRRAPGDRRPADARRPDACSPRPRRRSRAPSRGCSAGSGSMYENNLYLNDLFELLATPVGIEGRRGDGSEATSLRTATAADADGGHAADSTRPTTPGELVFDQVTFRYPGREEDALSDVSFRIAPGETVAVVGRNGAGKSTLIKLVTRLYDPTAGRILLDGIDLRELEPSAVRQLIGGMFQDYVTYQASAAENIGLGELGRLEDREAIEEAARKGGADSLLDRLPDGWDTPLGKWFDGGVELSGGEWQKIALGRAFMRDAGSCSSTSRPRRSTPRRSSSCSPGSGRWPGAGRRSTSRTASRRSARPTGSCSSNTAELVEEGTHAELMALGGRYAQLFTLQAAAYTGEPIDDLLAADEADAAEIFRSGALRRAERLTVADSAVSGRCRARCRGVDARRPDPAANVRRRGLVGSDGAAAEPCRPRRSVSRRRRRAADLHERLTVVDLHADSLLWGRDLLDRANRGHVDVPRMIEGNAALQVFAVATKVPRHLNYRAERRPDRRRRRSIAIGQGWPRPTWRAR